MLALVGAAWFVTWILITIIGSLRLLAVRSMRRRQDSEPIRSVSEANWRRVSVGTAIFALLCGDVISTPSIQHLVTKPTPFDVILVIVVLPPLVLSARQLLFVS
jgi:hypothetical protein